MNYYLVTYDIVHPSRLKKVADICTQYGDRMQYSVFLMELEPLRFQNLRSRLERLLHPKDSICFFPLCDRDFSGIKQIGYGALKRKRRSGFVIL